MEAPESSFGPRRGTRSRGGAVALVRESAAAPGEGASTREKKLRRVGEERLAPLRFRKKPLVSVLIPAHNAQRWVDEAIRSALAQSYPEKEVIVVDDGSRDATLEVARSFRSPLLKVVTQENRGASAARNHALSLAQGDFIQWLDADNLLARDKIDRQLEGMESDPALLISSAWGYFHYRWQRARFVSTSLWEDLTPAEWLLRKLRGNVFMVPEAWLVSRRLTEAAGPWNEALSLDDDGEYFSRVIALSRGTRFVAEAKSYYRCANALSLSSMLRRPEAKLRSQFASAAAQIQLLRTLDSGARSTAACLDYLQDSLIYFYPESPELVRQAEELAQALGGSLTLPQLAPKYAWVAGVFGWRVAKNVTFTLPALKNAAHGCLDRVLRWCQRDGMTLP